MPADLARRLASADLSEETVMALSLREARSAMIPFRVSEGFKPLAVNLLTEPSGNLKLQHSGRDMVAAYGLTLAPSDLSGIWNTCRYATKCRDACLGSSGNGRYATTQRGRVWKTQFLGEDPVAFLRCLAGDIDAIPVSVWEAHGFTVSFRLNVLSDLPWETLAPWILQRLTGRGIKVYDYTKWPSARRDRSVSDAIGYYLVDSVSERHSDEDIKALDRPVVVFDVRRGAPLPCTYLGRPVIDADVSDARFLDPAGTVRGLRYKEVQTTKRADAVASGFVRSA